jgi:hypothetical protein
MRGWCVGRGVGARIRTTGWCDQARRKGASGGGLPQMRPSFFADESKVVVRVGILRIQGDSQPDANDGGLLAGGRILQARCRD